MPMLMQSAFSSTELVILEQEELARRARRGLQEPRGPGQLEPPELRVRLEPRVLRVSLERELPEPPAPMEPLGPPGLRGWMDKTAQPARLGRRV